MPFPSFLIIGAMKAGTTSLFRDLGFNPDVFVPEDKEPEALSSDGIFTPEGISKYKKLFATTRRGELCGEASTGYSKRGAVPGVPARARQVLGPDLKLIYLVRDPVERIISHHHHDVAFGAVVSSIDRAVRERPRYLNTSRYMWQMEAWLEAFPREQLHIVRFEDYIRERRTVVDDVSTFLGIRPGGAFIQAQTNFNPSEGRRGAIGLWKVLARSELYRQGLRRALPWQLRARIRERILPLAPPRPEAPRPATVAWLEEQLFDDVTALTRFLNAGEEPLWERWSAPRFTSRCGADEPGGSTLP